VQGTDPGSWTITVLIRNGSELPVWVDSVDVTVRPWGYERVLGMPEGTAEVDYYAAKRFGDSHEAHLAPGTVAPAETRSVEYSYQPEAAVDRPEPPKVSVTRAVIADAAGYQWELRSGKVGPARRVQRWRRWWWMICPELSGQRICS
jgi:hypothetical protein